MTRIRKIAVVTTFSKAGWDAYARRMVESWADHWPTGVDLFLYPDEPVEGVPARPNIRVVRESIPERDRFVAKYGGIQKFNGGGTYNYRFDAVKFCHKPFCLWHFARHVSQGMAAPYEGLIWLDADTITHADVPLTALDQFAPPRADIQFLGRAQKYTECGYLYFNLTRPRAMQLLERWVNYYIRDTFRHEREWHDSWLYDRAREVDHTLQGIDLTGHLKRNQGSGHPLINSFLGGYLDHLKGDSRKAVGKPRKGDLFVNHETPYWEANAHAKVHRDRSE